MVNPVALCYVLLTGLIVFSGWEAWDNRQELSAQVERQHSAEIKRDIEMRLAWFRLCRSDGRSVKDCRKVANGIILPPLTKTQSKEIAKILGKPGKAGALGPAGVRGLVGRAGLRGQAGIRGQRGPAGAVGAVGPRGQRGHQGQRGVAGVAGGRGPAGARGPAGVKGAKGERGPRGFPGSRGSAGAQGAQGPRGPQGPAGSVASICPNAHVLEVRIPTQKAILVLAC